MTDTEYTDKVQFVVLIPVSQVSKMTKDVTESTSGQAKITEEGSLYYAIMDGTYQYFS